MNQKNIPSKLLCCKLLICFLLLITFDSLTDSEKKLYRFGHITDSITKECNDFRKHVLSPTAFIRNRKWGFTHYINHIIFNQRKTLRNNIDTYLKYVTDGVSSYTKQSFSEQRININLEVFKKISLNYLKNIGYLNNKKLNPFFRTFYGFMLYAGDGSLFEIPDKELTLNEFGFPEGYEKVPKVKFSGIVDVLNNFIIDGIMGRRGVGEHTLIHQNLRNVANLIIPQKSIFIFDRGYNSMELMARIINMNSFFVIRLRKDTYIGKENI